MPTLSYRLCFSLFSLVFLAFHTFSIMKNNLELNRAIFSWSNYWTATASRAAGRISKNRVPSPRKSVEEWDSKKPNKTKRNCVLKTALKRNINTPFILSYMNYFSIVRGYGTICIPMFSQNYIKKPQTPLFSVVLYENSKKNYALFWVSLFFLPLLYSSPETITELVI